jgi:RNA polymerase sigma-70 factor (ECF subfamily)
VDERELIRLAQEGDETAWVALVREYQQPVFRLAYLVTGDSDEAEDVAQEAFVRAFRHIHSFDTARPLRPWLLQIAKNVARNRRRSLRRYLASLTRLYQSVPPAATEPAQPVDNEALWEAIRRLGMDDQEIIYVRYFLGLSVAETADALEIAEGTVKSRLARAIQRLREVVRREFPGWAEEGAL